jgi:hypothetical protein
MLHATSYIYVFCFLKIILFCDFISEIEQIHWYILNHLDVLNLPDFSIIYDGEW